MGRIAKDGDVIAGAVLAALGVYVVMEAWGWDYLGPDGPGPGFFPLWYGIAMVALSLVLVVQAVRNGREQGVIDWSATGRALTTWAAFAGSIVLMSVLGFVVSFALLTFFVILVIFRRPPVTAAIAAVVMAVAFHVTFPILLSVQLPTGYFGF